jgi:hypothetical protein
MKKSILRYLLTMSAIAAPTKANNTAPVVPQTQEQLLEKAFRSLSTIPTLVLAPIRLTILGISMLPTVTKPLVLWGALFLLAGLSNILNTIAAGLSAVLMWLIDMPMFATYW